MMDRFKKADKQRLELIKNLIEDYFTGDVLLENVPWEIESPLQALETVNEKDKQDIFNQWAILEEIYAVMLDQNQEKLQTKEQLLFNRALIKIKEIVNYLLSKYECIEYECDDDY